MGVFCASFSQDLPYAVRSILLHPRWARSPDAHWLTAALSLSATKRAFRDALEAHTAGAQAGAAAVGGAQALLSPPRGPGAPPMMMLSPGRQQGTPGGGLQFGGASASGSGSGSRGGTPGRAPQPQQQSNVHNPNQRAGAEALTLEQRAVVNIAVDRGRPKIVKVIAAAGSGKSTCLRHLAARLVRTHAHSPPPPPSFTIPKPHNQEQL